MNHHFNLKSLALCLILANLHDGIPVATFDLKSASNETSKFFELLNDEHESDQCAKGSDSFSIPQNDKSEDERASAIKIQKEQYQFINRTFYKPGGIAGENGTALAEAEFK